jgi:hypothetical protein
MNNVESIIQFLEDISPAMIDSCGNLGLTEKGVNGLAIIYQTLGETVRAAAEAIEEDHTAMVAKEVTT